jgi:alkanesulfonate monooxygenase SsuD/methylene tetrahydromethanopterin reductase-like flavin-dependent oxidoreductase (luciferase family)
MYNFHWMYKCATRDVIQDFKEIKILSETLEENGYDSINLSMHDFQEDNWINAAHIIDPSKKIKYQLTIKPFATTAAYCGMMLYSFNRIAPDRVVVGISNGMPTGEPPFSKRTSSDERRLLSGQFAKDLKNFKLKNRSLNKEIIFHGKSEQTIKNTEEVGDGIMMLLRDLREQMDVTQRLMGKRIMVRFSIYITDEKRSLPQSQHPLEQNNIIYGTEEEIIKQLDELKTSGVTDFLISNLDVDKDVARIHNFVKKLTIGN